MRQACIITLFILFFHFGFASARNGNPLVGRSFSDPSQKTEMPGEWKQGKIQYKEWAQGADMAISINQHIAPAVLTLKKEYEKKHGITIAFKTDTCGVSMSRIMEKAVDIGTLCCPPARADRLPGIKIYTLGIAPVALFVNAKNPVDTITMEEARKMYQGEILKWSELGGPDMPIHLVTRLHCKKRPGLWRMLLKDEDLFSFRIHNVSSISANLSEIVVRPFAVSFDNLWQMHHFHFSDKIRPLRIDGLDPRDGAAIASGRYPLYLTYTLLVWEQEGLTNQHAIPFVKYLLKGLENADGDFYFVPVSTLKKTGWKFSDDELIGEPGKQRR